MNVRAAARGRRTPKRQHTSRDGRDARTDGTVCYGLDGSIPAGRSVRFVHFNPDDSHGDIFFDAAS